MEIRLQRRSGGGTDIVRLDELDTVISGVVEILRNDGYLALIPLTHGKLAVFHRLMKYVDSMALSRAHPNLETYSYKCATALKTLTVEYLLMQNRQMTGEENDPKTLK